MGALEGANIFGIQIRESANDGSDFSNAASDYRILFVGEDGLFHLKDSAGTVTTPGGGMSDPMTTRGDIIVRNASNVTARLGRGSAGTVFTSDGTDVAWAAPTAPSFVGCRVYNSGTQSIASGAARIVTFDSEEYDTSSMHDTGSNTGRLVAPSTGKYLLHFQGYFNTNPGATNYVYPFKNNTTSIKGRWRVDLSSSAGWTQWLGIIALTASDYIEFLMTVATTADLGASSYETTAEMVYLGA